MADSGHSTATLRLKVGDLAIAHPLTVPNAAVPATAVLPALQGLVNEVVGAAEARQQAISCRKGCGACCRQLVPISRTEGEACSRWSRRCPRSGARRCARASRRRRRRSARAGLAERGGGATGRCRSRYFALRRALPVPRGGKLLDPSRPAAGLPRVSRHLAGRAVRRAGAGRRDAGAGAEALARRARTAGGAGDDWFPLAMLMAWGRDAPGGGKRRPGTEWVQRFLKGSVA